MLDPALPIFFGVNKDGIELTIEPVHVTPRHTFKEAVLGKNADILWKIGVINAARLQVEHFGREQRGQSNWPGRADDNLSEFFPLYVIQHLENRRETQFLQFVLGQFKFANGREILDGDVANLQLTPRCHDDEFLPADCSGRGHFPDCGGHAVNVFERVREPRAFAVLQFVRHAAKPFRKRRWSSL